MTETTLTVPDIGDFTDVEIIEVLVNEGDSIAEEDSLITLETDKATMDIPASMAGTITGMLVKVGDRVSEGDAIAKIEAGAAATAESKPEESPPDTQETDDRPATEDTGTTDKAEAPAKPSSEPSLPKPSPTAHIDEVTFSTAHASPSVRRVARELGVTLPVAAYVEQVETGLIARGHGDEDVSVIARSVREASGIEDS